MKMTILAIICFTLHISPVFSMHTWSREGGGRRRGAMPCSMGSIGTLEQDLVCRKLAARAGGQESGGEVGGVREGIVTDARRLWGKDAWANPLRRNSRNSRNPGVLVAEAVGEGSWGLPTQASWCVPQWAQGGVAVLQTNIHKMQKHIQNQAAWAEGGVCVMEKQIKKVEQRIQDLLLQEKQQQIKNLFAAAAVVGVGVFGGRVVVSRWIQVQAGLKFRSRAALYLTIPLISGLLNWATNQLAVFMIFSPLQFTGLPVISRPRAGEPLGWFGWQGIVPAKVEKMAGDIVDLTVNELLNVKDIFAAVDEGQVLARMHLNGTLLRAVADAAEECACLPKPLISEARLRAKGHEASLVSDTLVSMTDRVVTRVIRALKSDPLRYCPVKRAVVHDMYENKKILCELFQRCGEAELRFIIDMGLWGGLALGLVQMALWLMWSPKWTLTAGGAAVGYVTNLVALKVMFQPVEPYKGPAWLEGGVERVAPDWPGFQGLFLTRQEVVSQEFAAFMATKVLTPRRLWEAILLGVPSRRMTVVGGVQGTASQYVADPEGQVNAGDLEIEIEIARALAREPLARILIGDDEALGVYSRHLRPKLLAAVCQANDYFDITLGLEQKLAAAMRKMKSAKFERVLHPIFEEDEMTLILVGGVLGGIAGYAQTFFY